MPGSIPTIDHFMTPDPCGADEGLTLTDAADRMRANNIRHLLVLRDARLVGVVSAADLELAMEVSGDAAGETTVRKAMRPPFTCVPNVPVAAVARDMEAHHYECAVVVGADNTVVGIFTLTDALRALRELAVGHDVAPEVAPTHHPDLPSQRKKALPDLRVKRLLRSHRAAPSPNDGKVLGTVI